MKIWKQGEAGLVPFKALQENLFWTSVLVWWLGESLVWDSWCVATSHPSLPQFPYVLFWVCVSSSPFFSFLRIPATGFRAHSKFRTSHIKVFNHVCKDSVFKEKYMNRYQDLEFRHLSVGHYSNYYMVRQKCFFISVVLQTCRGTCHLLPNLSGSKA